MPDKKSVYWLSRAMADEARANRIANEAAAEIRQMYRRQYLKIVQQITQLRGEMDAGKELTRTQLWNYSRWRQLESELNGFVSEASRFNIARTESALNAVFEKTIGVKAESLDSSRMTLPISARQVINTTWSGERYSQRIWKNQAAIAERLQNSMEDMLVQGRGLKDIKKQIMKEFDVAYNDADRLVRTEAAYVLNRANVAKYREAGLKKIRWSTGPEDGRECAICAARSDRVYWIDEAPMIPAHPRCRCIYAGVVELDGEDIPVDGPEADAALEAAQADVKKGKALRKGNEEIVNTTDMNKNGIAQAGRIEANGMFVNSSEALYQNAKKVKPITGYEDFTCHSDAYNFYIDMKGKGDANDYYTLTPEDYAKVIKTSNTYKGGDVRILSCMAGAETDGAAQRLADALGVDVFAPTEVVNIADNGEIFVSDNDILADLWYNASDRSKIRETGKWILFHPRKE